MKTEKTQLSDVKKTSQDMKIKFNKDIESLRRTQMKINLEIKLFSKSNKKLRAKFHQQDESGGKRIS